MILEQESYRIQQKCEDSQHVCFTKAFQRSQQLTKKFSAMIFRSLETCNRHRIQRQQQQQFYMDDALTSQFSGIFMPQLTDVLPFQTECSKLAARPLRKSPFQPAQPTSVFQHYSNINDIACSYSVNYFYLNDFAPFPSVSITNNSFLIVSIVFAISCPHKPHGLS